MAREIKDKSRAEPAKRPEQPRAARRREVDAAAKRAIEINREALTELAKW